MIVLAHPHPGLVIRVRFRQSGDIDVQSVAGIDPPGIDDIIAVATFALLDGRVYIEQVGAFHGYFFVGLVVIAGLIVMIAEVVEGGAGDLGVDVPIPGEHLNVTVSA